MIKMRELHITVWIFCLFYITELLGCSYQLGFSSRSLPGGYNEVAVPVFKNYTQEVGIETYFTNELIRQLAQSGVAQVIPRAVAAVVLEGSIDELRFDRTVKATQNEIRFLPLGSVLTTEYRIYMGLKIRMKRISDNLVLWQDTFHNERVYFAPQVGSPGINSSDSLYNQNARQQNIAKMAKDMIVEVHDRLTENF